MTFFQEVGLVYRSSWDFIRAGWFLAALVVLPWVASEILGQLPSLQGSGARWIWIGFGILTWIAAVPIFYANIRFLSASGGMKQALAINKASIRTFWPFAIFMIVLEPVTFFALFLMGQTLLADVLAALQGLLLLSLALWAVSAPSGGNVISPLQSIKHMFYRLPWAILFVLVVSVPIYLLALVVDIMLPDAGEAGTTWSLMSIGAQSIVLFVAWVVANTSIFVIAQHCGLRTRPLE